MTHSENQPPTPESENFEETIDGKPATNSEVADREGSIEGKVNEKALQQERDLINERNQVVRDNENAARGLILGLLLAGLLGAAALAYVFTNRQPETVPGTSPAVVPDLESSPSPPAIESSPSPPVIESSPSPPVTESSPSPPVTELKKEKVIERPIEKTKEVPVPASPAPAPEVEVNTPPPVPPKVEINVPPIESVPVPPPAVAPGAEAPASPEAAESSSN